MGSVSDFLVVSREDSKAGKIEGSVLVITMTVSDGLDAAKLELVVAPGREIGSLAGVVDVLVELAASL